MLDMEIIEPEILELEPQGNIPRIESDYNNLYNKPSIEGKELRGFLSLDDLNIQPKGNYALKEQIPTKLSELSNDKGFITEIPSEYVTEQELHNKGYITNQELSNKGYITNVPEEYITETELSDKKYITNTVNDLFNYYLKKDTYTKQEVNNLISTISTINILVVSSLPTVGKENVIYLVPKEAEPRDTYNEYIYVNNNWEHIGNTKVDLSDYYTKSQTNNLLNEKANVGDIPVIPENISAFNNDKGYLNAIPNEYIKNTDYATDTTGGAVKVSGSYGISVRTNGILQLATATTSMIDEKTNIYRPITPSNLNYAVKSALNDGIFVYDEETETLSITI